MEPILEWAREWQALVAVIGTVALLLYVRETYLIRLAAITNGAPSVRLVIADAQGRPRLRVLNIEGRVAYNVTLDGFSGTLEDQPVRCSFEPIPHLRPEGSEDVRARIETPDGQEFFEEDSLLAVLRSATGRVTRLPLRLRFQDGMSMKYVVKVEMPNRIELGLRLKREPVCSPPIPLVMLARVEDRFIWPVVRAVKHRRIKREVMARPRRRRAAVDPTPIPSEEPGPQEEGQSDVREEDKTREVPLEGRDAFRRTSLEAAGFRGFVTVRDLSGGRIDDVPREPGTYVVMRARDDHPTFLRTNPAGWFKEKNPTTDVSVLEAAWVPGARTLYIGQTSQRDGLRARVKDLIDFGAGKPVGHWGGRYLWQVDCSSDFVVAWRRTPPGANPRDEERELLRRFHEAYGRLPYANLKD